MCTRGPCWSCDSDPLGPLRSHLTLFTLLSFDSRVTRKSIFPWETHITRMAFGSNFSLRARDPHACNSFWTLFALYTWRASNARRTRLTMCPRRAQSGGARFPHLPLQPLRSHCSWDPCEVR